MLALNVDAVVDSIPYITDTVNEALDDVLCPFKVQTQIDIAIDELFSNIAYYAYASSETPGKAKIVCDIDPEQKTVSLTFIDNGVPYNPLEKKDPDVTLSAEERDIGGLGIFMVKKSMDSIIYEYKDNENRLTILKKW